jgi:hypothetical protein
MHFWEVSSVWPRKTAAAGRNKNSARSRTLFIQVSTGAAAVHPHRFEDLAALTRKHVQIRRGA